MGPGAMPPGSPKSGPEITEKLHTKMLHTGIFVTGGGVRTLCIPCMSTPLDCHDDADADDASKSVVFLHTWAMRQSASAADFLGDS